MPTPRLCVSLGHSFVPKAQRAYRWYKGEKEGGLTPREADPKLATTLKLAACASKRTDSRSQRGDQSGDSGPLHKQAACRMRNPQQESLRGWGGPQRVCPGSPGSRFTRVGTKEQSESPHPQESPGRHRLHSQSLRRKESERSPHLAPTTNRSTLLLGQENWAKFLQLSHKPSNYSTK